MASDLKTTRRKDMAKLRKKMDGDDGFMGGHQIKKVRQLFGQRDTPLWAASDTEVRKVLLRAFPKLNREKNQRAAAARWSQAITLVYRVGMPYNHAASEMGLKVGTLRSLLRNIRRVARGQRSDTRAPLGLRPRGRPKK